MAASTFLATTGPGLARATKDSQGQWTVTKHLEGLPVNTLAADPHRQDVVLAGLVGGGVWLSEDQGLNWRPLGLAEHDVRTLAFSKTQPDLVFAGTRPAMVHVSRDGGASWAELDSFRRIRGRRLWFSPAGWPLTAYPLGLTVSPTDPDVVMVGIELGAVVRSADGGRSWSNHLPGSLRDCHSMTFNANDSNWVYEGGGTGGGAAFSQDGGLTWTQHKEGLDRNYGWAAAGDPADPRIWYVSVAPGPGKAHGSGPAEACIFRAEADGPWQKLGGGLPDPLPAMPYALLPDPDEPGHIYAGLSNGDVWHSADRGDNWRQLPPNLGHISRVMIML